MMAVKLDKFKSFIESRYEKLFCTVDFSYYTDFDVIDLNDIDLNDCIIEAEISIINEPIVYMIKLIKNGADCISLPIDAIIYITWNGFRCYRSATWKSSEISLYAVLQWNHPVMDWIIKDVTDEYTLSESDLTAEKSDHFKPIQTNKEKK